MYIYGRNVIKEIISVRYSVKQVYVSNSKNTDKELASIVQKAKANGYSVSYVSDDNLKNLVNYDKHQGVVIDIGKEYEYYDTDYLEKKKENAFI
ncbi:MAG TPA: RNA methyltransferase substrate-binding domain-containing protein, partial [Petrotogaceae bacterium]|nr:RNA methyltransferase substrate-binding domain-containing protein [Petrotogaceae bacterium]